MSIDLRFQALAVVAEAMSSRPDPDTRLSLEAEAERLRSEITSLLVAGDHNHNQPS